MANTCPKCKSENPDTQSFCGDFGTQLGHPQDIPEVTKTFETPFPQFRPGKSLADRYEIIKELGKGGMGEVYLAEDTNLKRQVAIKVLPQQFAMDKERLARFEREARLLASINHPNIATIHGLEKSEDQQFLVMELIEGDTLRERIEKGPLAKDEALEVCQQIAEGLESAHEKGIIHRDLKPANVKVTPEGNVKILDFGIAKVFQDRPDETDPSQSPVITDEMTRPGMILGTAAYMSPEQAKGKAVDKRADIWAFGCILFECLAGKRAFKGDTISEMLASILKDELDWKALPGTTPKKIRELIGHCVVKDARDRLHDIADARIVIQECISGIEDTFDEPPSIPKKPVLSKYAPGVPVGLLVGLLLATLIPWGSIVKKDKQNLREVQRLEMVMDKPWGGYSPVISPDGSRVLFRQGENPVAIFQRHLGQRHAIQIPGTEGAGGAFFSPNSQWLGFFQDNKLKKIPLSGGDSQVLCDADNPFGGTWGTDGTIVFVPHVTKALWRVHETGGEPQRLTTQDRDRGEWAHERPVFLPDGQSVLFAIWYGARRYNVALLDLKTGQYKVILKNASFAIPSPTGHLVFARPDGLYAVGFNSEKGDVFGPEVPFIRDIFVDRSKIGLFSISPTGTLAYYEGSPIQTELVSVDLDGNATPLPSPKGSYRTPRYSPDASQIVVNIYKDGDLSYWIVDPKTGRLSKVASDGQDLPPLWSIDGDKLLYQSDRSGIGEWKTYQQPIVGGEAELVVDPIDLKIRYFQPSSFSSDGRFLLGNGLLGQIFIPNAGAELLYWSILESKFTTLMERIEGVERYNVQISPGGDWVLFCEWERFPGGQDQQVYVTRFPEGGERYKVTTNWGNHPLWSPDGRQIYFRHGPDLMVVDVQTEPEFLASSPRVLFNYREKKYSPGNFYTFPNWDIAPDGKSFIMLRFHKDWEPPRHINITTNFFEELKQKVPTGK